MTILNGLLQCCIKTNLVKLVDGYGYIDHLVGEAAHLRQACEHLAVVDFHAYPHVKQAEHLLHNLHQLQLAQLRTGAYGVNITLIKLAVATLLGTVGTPDRLNLETLERE